MNSIATTDLKQLVQNAIRRGEIWFQPREPFNIQTILTKKSRENKRQERCGAGK